MFVNKKNIGVNLLFYLLSIIVVFILIRVLFKKFIVFPKLREGLVEAKDIQDVSKVRNYKMRNDGDSGKITADNLFNPGSEMIISHLDYLNKYRNKRSSEDMKTITQMKKSAYKNIKETLQKGYESIKKDCSPENKLFERRNKEFKEILEKSPYKEKKKKLMKKWKKWAGPLEEKNNIISNKKQKEQDEEFFLYMYDTGLHIKLQKDGCNMIIEDPDTNKGNLIAKQKMTSFLDRMFEKGNQFIDNLKEHAFVKKIEEEHEIHQKKEAAKKEQEKRNKKK